MKKIILTAVAAMALFATANAQTVISNNYDSPISSANPQTSNENSFVKGTDINVSYNSDSKIAGISWLTDVSDCVYMGLGAAADIDGFDTMSMNFGLGLGKRYLIGSSFLVQGKIGPYAGWTSYTVQEFNDKGKTVEKDKNKFNYGADASIAAGIKLWDTKKGNSTFITVGYYLNSNEFDTKDLFKNGSWGIGFTTVFN